MYSIFNFQSILHKRYIIYILWRHPQKIEKQERNHHSIILWQVTFYNETLSKTNKAVTVQTFEIVSIKHLLSNKVDIFLSIYIYIYTIYIFLKQRKTKHEIRFGKAEVYVREYRINYLSGAMRVSNVDLFVWRIHSHLE